MYYATTYGRLPVCKTMDPLYVHHGIISILLQMRNKQWLTVWWRISCATAAFASDNKSSLASNKWKLSECNASRASTSGATSPSMCFMKMHVVSMREWHSFSSGTWIHSSMYGHTDCKMKKFRYYNQSQEQCWVNHIHTPFTCHRIHVEPGLS